MLFVYKFVDLFCFFISKKRLEKYLIKVEAHAQLSLLYFTEASFEVGRGNFEKALEISETKAQHEIDVSGAQPSNSPELVSVAQVPIILHAELGMYLYLLLGLDQTLFFVELSAFSPLHNQTFVFTCLCLTFLL